MPSFLFTFNLKKDMNPIQLKQRIDFYNDLTRNARFTFTEYAIAVNDVVQEFIFENLGDKENRNPKNFQWIDRINDQLYTLIKTATPALVAGTAITNKYYTTKVSTLAFPNDYSDFVALNLIIDGLTVYGRPTSFNKLQPLLRDSFKHPTSDNIFYNWNSTGLSIYYNGTASAASLIYIKGAVDYSIGQEANLIDGPVLLSAGSYYATAPSVYNGVSYQIGSVITGGFTLSSGQVIPVSVTSPIDLPSQVHEEIAKRASVKMLIASGNYPSAQAVQSEASKTV
jgi:hypothetical protein